MRHLTMLIALVTLMLVPNLVKAEGFRTPVRTLLSQQPVRLMLQERPVRSFFAQKPMLRALQARPVRSFLFR